MRCSFRLRKALVFAAVLTLNVFGWGCRGEREPTMPTRVVVHTPAPLQLGADWTAEAVVSLTIAEGYHVQANPVPFPYLIPTQLQVESGDEWTVGTPVYPTGKPYQLAGTTDTLSVYDGTIAIRLPLRVGTDAHPGRHILRGRVRYQLCDDRRCFQPVDEPVVLSVDVGKPDSAAFAGCPAPAEDIGPCRITAAAAGY